MPAASERVFSIPELLVAILLELDMRTLLASAQLVNRTFHQTIAGVPALQVALFFASPSGGHGGGGGEDAAGSRVGADVTKNPLLAELFAPWFLASGSGGDHATPRADLAALAQLPMLQRSGETGVAHEAFLRSGASWRRMLVQLPPIEAVGIWEHVEFTRADTHAFRRVALTHRGQEHKEEEGPEEEEEDEQQSRDTKSSKQTSRKRREKNDRDGSCLGLTMGALYDATVKHMRRPGSTFRVIWIAGSDMSYLERRPLSAQMSPEMRREAAQLVRNVGMVLELYRSTHASILESSGATALLERRVLIAKLTFPQRGGAEECRGGPQRKDRRDSTLLGAMVSKESYD
ncbi:hypothetical protein BX600DRAFT_518509 [Xylariales sp. PMI_506]|nr:hypothetical protein BX600DRAFT_518509 [Xylariales sp. PMI_506]